LLRLKAERRAEENKVGHLNPQHGKQTGVLHDRVWGTDSQAHGKLVQVGRGDGGVWTKEQQKRKKGAARSEISISNL